MAAIRPWLMTTAVLNAAWIGAVALHRPGWTVPIIFLMLATAIVMHRAGQIGEAVVDPAEAWLRLPFSLYVGWLIIATFANVSTELARVGWDGFGWSPVTWGILLIVVSSVVGLVTRFRLDDPVLGGVFVWAYLAIVVQQQQRPLVSLFAGIAAALCLLSLFVRDRQAPHSTSQRVRRGLKPTRHADGRSTSKVASEPGAAVRIVVVPGNRQVARGDVQRRRLAQRCGGVEHDPPGSESTRHRLHAAEHHSTEATSPELRQEEEMLQLDGAFAHRAQTATPDRPAFLPPEDHRRARPAEVVFPARGQLHRPRGEPLRQLAEVGREELPRRLRVR